MEKKVVIVGGGFAGISAALELEKKHLPETKIILISDKPHFEFHASLYRVLTGHSPLEVCIPLGEIFKGKNIELVQDTIKKIDIKKKELKGESDSRFTYDYLVLAMGSEVNFYNIDGLKDHSFNINTITECLRLKRHLHESFSQCKILSKEEKKCNTHIVVVGGGASGCEVAGELAKYTQKLAKQHNIDPSLINIDLIHAGPRILEFLPESIALKISQRLVNLGVRVMVDKRLLKGDIETVYFPDVKMKTKTLIWTAGVQSNRIYNGIDGFDYDDKGRVKVNQQLQGYEGVYIVGDGSSSKFSGMARPAINQGKFAANSIFNSITSLNQQSYNEPTPKFIIPIGQGWAATNALGPMIYGRLGWIIKRARDLIYFTSILPLNKALTAFLSDRHLTESCPICSQASDGN